MKTSLTTYGTPSIGCYLDHGNYSVDELNARTVKLAMDYGYSPDRETLNCLARFDYEVMKEDDSQWLSEMADSAIEWLNEQETRPFMYWANEGEANAFGLWANVEMAKEDVGFTSVRSLSDARRMGIETDPEDSSFPAADYRGEWLYVSDHGNATLYVRGEDGKDVKIWGIV